MTKNIISLSEPTLGEEEKRALCKVIDSGWITMGERVEAFEHEFAKLHRVKNAVAVNSCTAGLHLCLSALGIGPGDEVLVPSLTFVATANAVLYTKATPVFVDIESENLPHISLSNAKSKFTSKTKAVIVMHYGGYLVDLPAWRTFADENGIFLIEDAAHAPAVGQVGRISDAATFSFFTNKNMTTAEGGMVIARKASINEKIKRMRSHGMTSVTLDRHRGHAYSYDVTMLGYNYRMDELRAAMGLVQLKNLQRWNQRRVELTQLYRQELSKRLPEIKIPFKGNHETAAHLMSILLPGNVDREKVMTKLRKDAIQTSIHYPSIHCFSYYLNRFPGVKLPHTEIFSNRELTIPLHPSLDNIDVVRIVGALQNAISKFN